MANNLILAISFDFKLNSNPNKQLFIFTYIWVDFPKGTRSESLQLYKKASFCHKKA